MKKNVTSYFKYMGFILLMVVFSCNTEDDDSTDPGDPRVKFLGTWNVNESCERDAYSVQITEDPNNSAQVLIKNFANPGFDVGEPALGVVVNDVIKIDPNQKIGDDWTVDGQGKLISNSRMEWDYELYIGGSQDKCTAIYTR